MGAIVVIAVCPQDKGMQPPTTRVGTNRWVQSFILFPIRLKSMAPSLTPCTRLGWIPCPVMQNPISSLIRMERSAFPIWRFTCPNQNETDQVLSRTARATLSECAWCKGQTKRARNKNYRFFRSEGRRGRLESLELVGMV